MQANLLTFPATAKAPRSLKEPIKRSSWIEDVRYHRGFLVAFLRAGGAYVFSGVEPHVAGLVLAGTGGKSVGHALHQLLREKREDGTLGDWKYAYQYVSDEEEVKSLKEMMKRESIGRLSALSGTKGR